MDARLVQKETKTPAKQAIRRLAVSLLALVRALPDDVLSGSARAEIDSSLVHLIEVLP